MQRITPPTWAWGPSIGVPLPPSGSLMVPYQTQAVLRRTSRSTPLEVVGVTLDSTFFPGSAQEATGPLTLDKGLVALAPLSVVDAPDPAEVRTSANLDAIQTRSGVNGPERGKP